MDVSPAGEIGLGVCNSRLDEPHLASLMTADGETRWQHLSTDTPVCQYGEAILVGVDPVGNSVWADASHGGADEPWLLSKLDRNGAVVWQRALDELGGPDVPGGYALLDMDDDGNTYMFVMASYDLGFGGVGYFAKIGP
jgi:hypothetical protein